MKKKNGFTLMELLIVVAVIAALTAIALPTFTGARKKSNENADIQAVSALYTEMQAEYEIHGEANTQTVSGLKENFNNDMSEFGGLSFTPATGWTRGGSVTISVDTDGNFTANCT